MFCPPQAIDQKEKSLQSTHTSTPPFRNGKKREVRLRHSQLFFSISAAAGLVLFHCYSVFCNKVYPRGPSAVARRLDAPAPPPVAPLSCGTKRVAERRGKVVALDVVPFSPACACAHFFMPMYDDLVAPGAGPISRARRDVTCNLLCIAWCCAPIMTSLLRLVLPANLPPTTELIKHLLSGDAHTRGQFSVFDDHAFGAQHPRAVERDWMGAGKRAAASLFVLANGSARADKLRACRKGVSKREPERLNGQKQRMGPKGGCVGVCLPREQTQWRHRHQGPTTTTNSGPTRSGTFLVFGVFLPFFFFWPFALGFVLASGLFFSQLLLEAQFRPQITAPFALLPDRHDPATLFVCVTAPRTSSARFMRSFSPKLPLSPLQSEAPLQTHRQNSAIDCKRCKKKKKKRANESGGWWREGS